MCCSAADHIVKKENKLHRHYDGIMLSDFLLQITGQALIRFLTDIRFKYIQSLSPKTHFFLRLSVILLELNPIL